MTSHNKDAPTNIEAQIDTNMMSTSTSSTTMPGNVGTTATPSSGLTSAALPSSYSSKLPQTMHDTSDAVPEDVDESEEASNQGNQRRDASHLLSKIQKLQDQLFKMERGAGKEERLASLEAEWDTQLERVGSDKEREYWNQVRDTRARAFVRNTTGLAFGREWSHQRENSFLHDMMEQRDFDEELLQRRREWEHKHGIAAPQTEEPSRAAWLEAHSHDLFRPPPYWNTEEAIWNEGSEAGCYDQREHDLRIQLNQTLRLKHDAFRQWSASRRLPRRRSTSETSYASIESEEQRKWAKPKINYTEWVFFKYEPGPNDWEEKFAIDVLEGEPDSTVTRNHYRALKRKMQRNEEEVLTSVSQARRTLVPERIRLNGPQLSDTFKLLNRKKRRSLSSTSSHMVLLAPFRILVYHEKAIRARYDLLKGKFRVPDGDEKEGSPAAANLAEPRPQGMQQDDAEPQEQETSGESIQPDRGQGSRDDQDETIEPEGSPYEDQFGHAHTQVAMEHLRCLIEFIDTRILTRMEYLRGADCRRIHFRDLWYLFQPGDEVISRDGRQIYRVIGVVNPRHHVSSRQPFLDFDNNDLSKYFQVECVYVDFDGKKLGPVSKKFLINTFAGEKTVESLEVFPLRMHRSASAPLRQNERHQASSDWQAARQSSIIRGKRFFQAACMRLEDTFYNGPTDTGDEIESEVIVDFETALSSDENIGRERAPPIESLIGGVNGDGSVPFDKASMVECHAWCCAGEIVWTDSWVDGKRREEYIDSLIPQTYSNSKLPSVAVYPRDLGDTTGENALTDDEFVLMTHRVFAFVLRTRKWAELDLMYFENTGKADPQLDGNHEASTTTFDRLVLPPGHKEIVLSLISQYYRNRDSGRRSIEHSDIVRGKGKGLILLLHGAPGVGKTSTAEGVAELFKKPLFTITCGDLGSTAKEVERALDFNFNLAHRWGCILLLDEADIFLASRTDTDFERNGLVAVFLRVLEYYAGILFLTTNRVGVIDEAFRSRIHVSLYYPALGREETRKVFELNLNLIQERFDRDKRNIKIDTTDIIVSALDYFDHNVKARWNGRQIRNACQTALALAEFNAQGGSHYKILDPDAEVNLAVDNFTSVARAYLEFTKYLKQLYGIHEDARAKELGLRARETGRPPVQEQGSGTLGGTHFAPTWSAQSHFQPPGHLMSPFQTAQSQSFSQPLMPGQGLAAPGHSAQQPGLQVPDAQGGYTTHYGVSPSPTAPGGNFMGYGHPGHMRGAAVSMMAQPQPPQPSDPNQRAQSWAGQANPVTPNAAQISSTQAPPHFFQAQQVRQQNLGTTNAGPVQMSSATQANPSRPLQGFQQPMQQQQPTPEWPNFGTQALESGGPQSQPGTSS